MEKVVYKYVIFNMIKPGYKIEMLRRQEKKNEIPKVNVLQNHHTTIWLCYS